LAEKKKLAIPDEYLPAIEALPGDLRLAAMAVEPYLPGMGVKVAMILATEYRGQSLYFRGIDYLEKQIRDEAIRREYDQGVRIIELGLKYNLCRSAVEKIVARPDQAEDRQLRMF
jgi:Mor family transcriptional regulator